MSFLSMKFLLFLAAAVAGYYVIPRQLQWVWLLIFSYIFYLASGPAAAVFILTTTVTTFLGGLCLEHTDRALKRALRPDDPLHPVLPSLSPSSPRFSRGPLDGTTVWHHSYTGRNASASPG